MAETGRDPLAVVHEFFDAWNAKDWDRWLALQAEDVVHTGPDHPEPVIGREAIRRTHEGLGSALPDFRYDLTRVFAAGDDVCVEWRLSGTQAGPMPGPGGRISPTGRPIDVSGCFVLRVENGLVAEYSGHVDFLAFYRQLGVLPALSSDVGATRS